MASFWNKLKQSLFGSFRSSKKPARKRKKTGKIKKIKRRNKKRAVLKKRPKKKPLKKRTKGAVSSKRSQLPRKAGQILVGEVTHYFPKVRAGVIRLGKATLEIGETILIQGESSKLKQKIQSMQINRIPIERAKPGEEIGLEVKKPVREGDQVYKLKK